MIVGDFNTLLTPMARSTKLKINKETPILNDKIDQKYTLKAAGDPCGGAARSRPSNPLGLAKKKTGKPEGGKVRPNRHLTHDVQRT